jgi:hypothetical protein
MAPEEFEPVDDETLEQLERVAHEARVENDFRPSPVTVLKMEWERDGKRHLVGVDPEVVLALVEELRLLRAELAELAGEGEDV